MNSPPFDPQSGPPPEPLEIPHGELSPAALRGLVEAYVLREGTEYGERDVPLELKVAQVMRQLERGEARVIFDPQTEVVDLVAAHAMRRRRERPGNTG
jgi:uncharacterized protein YheU (UPF0270 family)